jgi:hypothetical protein
MGSTNRDAVYADIHDAGTAQHREFGHVAIALPSTASVRANVLSAFTIVAIDANAASHAWRSRIKKI